ncbi:hypothetical protein J0A67_21970 [Algoriphagus aestuariicola]|uniref:Uncharacterized protein n=1 Tax=Algoriphagus aestuariicola TaxID=1852016 RepID=A0ABS3BW83_9BACT|nr:hypothetical protein [Algoriphagus aestuariicola]MBN7803552.1 hypothetical protein [Algoriphagus aestuariicola]
MIVQASELLKYNEVLAVLKSKFSDYGVYEFDSKPQRSIIVRKSATVGVQITVRDTEIMIDACCPNIFVSGLIGFMSTIFPFYHNFEMKIRDFLRKTYN